MSTPVFYVGLHQPGHTMHFARACVSIRRLRKRKKRLGCPIILDSGAFKELELHGCYLDSPADYAADIARLVGVADIEVAVAQDYMCEPFMLERTGLTVVEHQRLTIERYDALIEAQPPATIMPVLQGYAPEEYATHVEMYGDRLNHAMWVGVGSVCKRQGDPRKVVEVLLAILSIRPDLRLHGFGVKTTSLRFGGVRELLYSADSLAWSYAARIEGRDRNDWREAQRFIDRLGLTLAKPWQPSFTPLLLASGDN